MLAKANDHIKYGHNLSLTFAAKPPLGSIADATVTLFRRFMEQDATAVEVVQALQKRHSSSLIENNTPVMTRVIETPLRSLLLKE